MLLVTGRMFRSVRPYATAGRDRGPGRLLPGRGRRRAGLAGAGCATSRSRSSSRARRSRRCRPRATRSTATSATSSTSPSTRPRPRRTRRSSTSRCTRSATCSPGSTEPPTKLVAVGDPVELDGLKARMLAQLRRAHVHLEVAAVLPRVREPGGDEGVGARVRRRASRVHARRETVAFGDGENDVEMLEWAGYGVAVENAHERVLAVADFVCPPVRRGGRGAGDRGVPT